MDKSGPHLHFWKTNAFNFKECQLPTWPQVLQLCV